MSGKNGSGSDLKLDLNFSTDGLSLEENGGIMTGEKPGEQKPASKEDMARLIAKNMAMSSNGFDDFDDYGQTSAPTRKASVMTSDKPKSSGKKTSSDNKAKTGSSSGNGKKKKKKKASASRKAAVILGSFVCVMIVGLGVFYLWGMSSYKDRFLDNTYINGVDVSGRTKSEAYKLVSAQSPIPQALTVTKTDGSVFSVKLSEIGYQDNTQDLISQYYTQQNHYAWFSSLLKSTDFSFDSKFSYDKDKLETVLKRKVIDSQSTKKPKDAYIVKDDDEGFVVMKETAGDAVDESKIRNLYAYVENALDSFTFEVDISGADCYEMPEVTSDMLEEACRKLNNLYDIEITFDFIYTTETLTGDRVMDWITFDTDDPAQGYSVDGDKAMEYVEELAEKYDTFGKDREFKTTNRGTITIPEGEGCYGWWIDQEKTRNLIVDLIEDGDSANTEPVYYVNPDSAYEYTCNEDWRTADTDYGDTYIEIDLAAQHLWYYKDGELKMESDIVSGYPSESRNTPGGVYKLWYKEKGKTLRGSSDGHSYESYVDYWNYVSTIGIGLHDASWQGGVFGGEKYKSSAWGSHGCVNMPLDKAKYVFDNIDLGTPVFMYW